MTKEKCAWAECPVCNHKITEKEANYMIKFDDLYQCFCLYRKDYAGHMWGYSWWRTYIPDKSAGSYEACKKRYELIKEGEAKGPEYLL